MILFGLFFLLVPADGDTIGTFEAIGTLESRRADAWLALGYTDAPNELVHDVAEIPSRSQMSFSISLLFRLRTAAPHRNNTSYSVLRNFSDVISATEDAIAALPSITSFCLAKGDVDSRLRDTVDDYLSQCNPYMTPLVDPSPPLLPIDTHASTAAAVRSIFLFGLPLRGFNSTRDRYGEQSELFRNFVAEEILPTVHRFTSVQRKRGLDVVAMGDYVSEIEYIAIIDKDLIFLVFAALGVMLIVYSQTRSVFLTICGLVHILMSFIAAYLPYYALGFRVSPRLIQMSIFIILGIGADDVFVVYDEWRRSHWEIGSNVNESLDIKMSVVYARSSRAMFVTTFTTIGAFVATAVSPIPALASFGIYTSFVILINYLYVITWFPAILLIWHRWFEFWNPCGICGSNRVPISLQYHPAYGKRMCECIVSSPTEDESAQRISDTRRWSTFAPARQLPSEPPFGCDDLIPRNCAVTDEGDVVPFASSQDEFRSTIASTIPKWILRLDRYASSTGGLNDFIAAPEEMVVKEMFSVASLTVPERVFRNWIFPFVRTGRWIILAASVILFAIMMVYGVQLHSSESWTNLGVPDSHPLAIGTQILNDYFGEKEGLLASPVCIVYGVDRFNPLDRSGVDPNMADPSRKGVIRFVPFNYTAEVLVQTAHMCSVLFSSSDTDYRRQRDPSAPLGFSNTSVPRIRVIRGEPMECFALDAAAWMSRSSTVPSAVWLRAASRGDMVASRNLNYRNIVAALPESLRPDFANSTANILAAVREFLRNDGAAYADDIKLGPQGVISQTTCFESLRNPTLRPSANEKEEWDHFVEPVQQHLQVPLFQCSYYWVVTTSTVIVREAAIYGVLSSLAFVYIVLILFVPNLWVATLAMVVVGFIVATIFASMVWMGWTLEYIESISLTILVGISVDFVVHYATAYSSCHFEFRQRRTRTAMMVMGTSITSGAITTILPGFLLIFATYDFFNKFGIFLCLSIGLSWICTNTLFVSLLLCFGPQSSTCMVTGAIVRAVKSCFTSQDSAADADADEPGEAAGNAQHLPSPSALDVTPVKPTPPRFVSRKRPSPSPLLEVHADQDPSLFRSPMLANSTAADGFTREQYDSSKVKPPAAAQVASDSRFTVSPSPEPDAPPRFALPGDRTAARGGDASPETGPARARPYYPRGEDRMPANEDLPFGGSLSP